MKFILGREKWFLENISHYFYEIKENGLLHRYWEKISNNWCISVDVCKV